MNRTLLLIRSSAIAGLATFSLAVMPAVAQQNQQGQQGGQQQAQQEDALIAEVGDAKIHRSDVKEVMKMLPPRLRKQPPEVLIPMAVDHLVMRELILDKARAQNLQDDPEIESLAKSDTKPARERAMVQIWLQRELKDRVTDQKVEQAYEDLKAKAPDQKIPPLEKVRPQIEQLARRKAMEGIRVDLEKNADITYYDPSGQPVQNEQGVQSN